MDGLLDWLSKQKDAALSDYAGLMDNYPNAQKFGSGLINNISQHIPSNADFKSPEAMRDWGTAAALNAPMGLAIKALHASPHSFDKFDISKIGTGEGAQSYGHGLYLAENPKTIEQYLVNGESQLTPQGSATSYIKDYQNNYDDALNGAKNRLSLMQYHSPENIAFQKDTIKALENKDSSIKNPNLNFELLNKHLSGQKLTPEEMALYEKNGSAMETPQLQRYNLGNANAQGGSPESRANLLHDSYHGTREFTRHDGTTSSAIDGFDLNRGGVGSGNRDGKLGVFSTNDPYVASEFAERRNNPFVMPLKIRMDNPLQPENYREISDLIDKHTQFKDSYKFPDGSNIRMVDDVINPEAARKELTDKGFDSVYLKNTTMDSIDKKPINQYVSLDPKNIRSRFAAFDPLRKNSSSLLASGLLGSLLLNNLGKDNNATTQ